MSRYRLVSCLGLAVLLAQAGCAAGKAYSRAGGGGDMMMAEPAAATAPADLPAGQSGEAAPVEEDVASQVARATSEGAADEAGTPRKVVYNGWFTVDVYEIRKAQEKLVALVEGMGGYMQETRGNLVVVRVPAEKFDAIEPELRKLGRVDDSQTRIQATDITARFVDTELRLKTKKKYLDTLTAMLEQAGALKDKLEVQKEIARVVEEIEALEGQLRLMRKQVALATVTVTFRPAHSGPRRTFRLPWGWLDTLGIENLIR